MSDRGNAPLPAVSGGAEWIYDSRPPGGAKVLLLTEGHNCVIGTWTNDGRYIAWHPMPKRDRQKELDQAVRLQNGGKLFER